MIHSADPARHVYLEPHFDDVALSCGGTVARQTTAGERVLVVTIFSGGPSRDVALTSFAAGQHDRWGDTVDPNETRRAEQRRALTILGADWLPLEFPDAIYRGDQYLSDEDLFGDPKPSDRALGDRLRNVLAGLMATVPEARLYAPLTIGHHVDHVLALDAAREFDPRLYEDFPYARRSEAVSEAVARVGAELAEEIDITETFDRRIAAIAAYRSQIPTLFGDADAMARETRRFATGRPGRAVERFWRPSRRR